MASGRQEIPLALRGIRGISAAFAAAYAVLFTAAVGTAAQQQIKETLDGVMAKKRTL